MKGTIETKAYTASVEYYNETLPMVGDAFDTDGMDFIILAGSFSEAEKMVVETVGDNLIKIWGIELMDAVPLF